jgi:hypothetical protein
LEARVVVELDVVGQADGAPMFEQSVQNVGGNDAGMRPGRSQMAVKEHGVEDLHLVAIGKNEPLDDVDGIQLGGFFPEVGQVPAWGRRRSTGANSAIENAVALEDAIDGAHGGQEPLFKSFLFLENLEDGQSADLAKGALLELLAGVEDVFLDGRRNAAGVRPPSVTAPHPSP